MSAASAHKLESTVKLSNGHSIPRVGLGTWRLSPDHTSTSVYEAIKLGYRHLDCARLYENEKEVGQGLKKAIEDGVVKREEMFVTTKVWNNAHSEKLCLEGIQTSLKELQLSYVDLCLVHWPVNFKYVEGNPFPKNEQGQIIHETDSSVASVKICWQTMEKAVDQGLIRSIGVSNFNEQQIEELWAYARIKPVAHQIEIHPFFQQDALIEFARKKSIITQGYCPLGNLKSSGAEDVTPLKDAVVIELGKKYSKSPAQIVLRWGLQHHDCVLPKSTNLTRLAENLALFDFELTDEDMAKLKEVGKKNHRFVNPPFNPDGSKFFP